MAKSKAQQAAIAISMKKAGKKPKKMEDGGPTFGDKVALAGKRISRNLSNRKALNLQNRAVKVMDTNKEKGNALYDKGDAAYQKAIDKNREIAKFKKEKGFDRSSSDGTMMGRNYSKPGKIWSKSKKGGAVKAKKK